ncbi:MAG: acyl-CoA dehydrogenase family protein [Actinomycetia bacterium]|nr:acyl-CoA dehydrogenase family protein [Actinomycetes bacterium]MCP5035613.1 acyl-CoA dehydrogenase family protein [Actinomycetes bacterium]
MIDLDAPTRAMLEELRSLGASHIRPLGLEADRTASPPPIDAEFFYICARQGGLVSKMVGEGEDPSGLDWKPVRNFLLGEEAAYWDRGVALSLPGPGLGGPALRNTGTPEQRERFLGIFTDPTKPRWGAMAMTEPEAGSDVARIQTRARREGDGWVLNGQKMFCSNSARADWVIVWATTDPALGRAGHRAFIVERGTPGFEILKIEHKMGSRGYETASFALDDVHLPDDNLLGGEAFYQAKRGFKASMATFNLTRPLHTAHGVGMGRAAHDFALEFVRSEYPTHGRRRDRALERLARIRRGLHTARMMYLYAVWLAKSGESNTLEASYAKLYAPPVILEAVVAALDICGEAGVRNDVMLEKLYRDVKILDIGEGTQQVQRVVVARQLFDFPRDP